MPRDARGAGALNNRFTMLDKTPTRLPDGLFFRFKPRTGGALAWRVDKLGSAVDPFDVQPGGNTRHHGVGAGVTATDAAGAALAIGAPDASLAVFGEPTIFPIGDADAAEGVAFLLQACLWNTNYPFWYPFVAGDENLRWRFSLAAA